MVEVKISPELTQKLQEQIQNLDPEKARKLLRDIEGIKGEEQYIAPELKQQPAGLEAQEVQPKASEMKQEVTFQEGASAGDPKEILISLLTDPTGDAYKLLETVLRASEQQKHKANLN